MQYIPENLKSVTRTRTPRSSIFTKGKIIDAQYEISRCEVTIDGPDSSSAKDNIDGLFINPGFTKSQWLNCQ